MVLPWRIAAAQSEGLVNVEAAAEACVEAGFPFFIACTLLQVESGGHNVYGHDEDGTLSGYPLEVDESNYRVFRWMVIDNGAISNGVGPTQITWAGAHRSDGTRDGGFFTDMEARSLRPWDPHDNMLYGFGILAWLYKLHNHSWSAAAMAYNGKESYGLNFIDRAEEWYDRLNIRGPLEP